MNLKYALITGVAAALVANAVTASAQNVRVTVDGGPIQFRGQPPIEVDDRVLVPLRGVFEDLGAQVNWNPGDQTVTARRGDTQVRLRIGERTASVNGEAVQLDVPAQIIQDSTMVPLRFVGEALGDRVHWDERTQTVSIITGGDEFARDHHDGGDYQARPRRDSQDYNDIPPAPRPPDRTRIIEEDIPVPVPIEVPEYRYETDTVIPANIDLDIDLAHCRPGDHISAVVPAYPGLPPNCRLTGVVREIGPSFSGRAPLLNIQFDTIETRPGHKFHIDAQAIQFNTDTVIRTGDGKFRASDHLDRGGFVRVDKVRKVGIRLNAPVRIERDLPSRETRPGRGQDRPGWNDRGNH